MKQIKNLLRENIKSLVKYSSARDEFSDKAVVFLDANENPFNNGLNRYPDPLQRELKKHIGLIKGIPTKNILLGNGSDEVLDIIIRAFCEPGKDNIILTPPTYGMYKVLADINNVEVRNAFLNKDFNLNVERIEKLISIGNGYVILQGGTGTMLELATVWEFINKKMISPKPIVTYSQMWKEIVEIMEKQIETEKRRTGVVKSFNTVDEIVSFLVSEL